MDWLSDVAEASLIVADEFAAALPPGYPSRDQPSFVDYGNSVALNKTILALELAVSATARDTFQRVHLLIKLAHALGARYRRYRSLTDLDHAVEALDDATKSACSIPLQPICRDLLAHALRKRFEATASIADLNRAIETLELTVDSTSHADMFSGARQQLLSSLRILRRQAMQPKGNIAINENDVLGHGSNGTTVYGGTFDGRDVAVKRVLLAKLEAAAVEKIDTLRKIDGHPNVIRYYYQEVQGPFHCIALDRCRASLAEVVAKLPLDDLPRLLLQIALGLGHLHANHVVHRDLKPNNILLRDAHPHPLRLVLSDFGLAKTLSGGQSSLTATASHVAGTFGWRAPELLLALDGHVASGDGAVEGAVPPTLRTSKKNDIFSLGLVFYYVLTQGRHPFGSGSRDMHMCEYYIRQGSYSLDGVSDAVACDLVESMLRTRPRIRTVLVHPFFWDAEKRLDFLCEASDDLEPLRRKLPSADLAELEGMRARVFEDNFLNMLPLALRNHITHSTTKRQYDGTKLQELLRLVCNMCRHYHNQSGSLRSLLGPLPLGFLGFWTALFPRLFLCCWSLSRWKGRAPFAKFYRPPTHA